MNSGRNSANTCEVCRKFNYFIPYSISAFFPAGRTAENVKNIYFDMLKKNPLHEQPYSKEEDTMILTYIEGVKKGYDDLKLLRSRLLANDFWKEAVQNNHMPTGRPWSSVKNRYKKLCQPAINVAEGEPVPAKQAVLSCSQPAATFTELQYRSQILADRLISRDELRNNAEEQIVIHRNTIQLLTNCIRKEYNY